MSTLLSELFVIVPSHLSGARWQKTSDVRPDGKRRWELQSAKDLGSIWIADLPGPAYREGDELTLTDGAIVRVDFAHSSEPFEYRLLLADSDQVYNWLTEDKLKTIVKEER